MHSGLSVNKSNVDIKFCLNCSNHSARKVFLIELDRTTAHFYQIEALKWLV